MSDNSRTDHVIARRRFLRTAGGLFLGAVAPLDYRDLDHAHRRRLWQQVPARAAWRHFEEQLALVFADLGADEFLTLIAPTPQWFVQAAHEGRRGLYLEAGATTGMFEEAYSLPEEVVTALPSLGWELTPSGDEGPQAAKRFAFPVNQQAAAALIVRTFADAYKIDHPHRLVHRAMNAYGHEVRFPALRTARQ